MKTRTFLSWGGAAALVLMLGGVALAQSSQDNPGVWLPFSASDYAEDIDFLYRVIFWVTTGMFVLTEGLLLLFCIIYRRRPGHRPTYTHGNNAAEITWTVIPALMLLGLALWQIPTWNHIKKGFPHDGDLDKDGKPMKVLTLDVIGEQYKWNVRYPGTKAKYKGDYDYTNLSNIHIPFGDAAVFNLRSKDVIHSVFIPHMRVKQDTVPGLRQKLWFRPNRFFLKVLKDSAGKPITPENGAQDGGSYYAKENDEWVKKPRWLQPMVFVYRDGDAQAPQGSLTAKDFEKGGKLFDKKVAVKGQTELNGWYQVPVINGVAKKVQVLYQGKVSDGALADCDYALGIFEMACAELCGMGHYTMRAFVYVEPPVSYEAWLASEMEDVSPPPPVWKYWRD